MPDTDVTLQGRKFFGLKDFAHKPTLIGKIVETLPDLKAIHYTASAEATGNGKAADEIISIFPYNRYQKNINWNTKIGDMDG